MMNVSHHGQAPPPTPRSLLRLRLNDVEVLDNVVSVGVFGEVREAVWTGTTFAARKLPEEENREEQMKSGLLWNSLNHPNIVMLMGVSASPGGDLWVVTELLTVDLASLLRSTPHWLWSLPFKLSILRDVACAVRYLHSLAPRPLLHGDLQAGHVFLTPSVRAKLDLGDTLFASNQEMRREITKGMLNADLECTFHLSPEMMAEGYQAVKKSGKTGSDAFSFGVLCLHILVHEVPIPKEAMIAVNSDDAIFFSEQERRAEYIGSLQGQEKLFLPIITQCLDPVASHRPNMTQLYHRLSQLQPQLSAVQRDVSVLNGGTVVDVSNHLQNVSEIADAASTEMETFQCRLRSLLGLAEDEMVPIPNTPTLPRSAKHHAFDFSYSPPVARLKSLPDHNRRVGRPPAFMSSERDIHEEDGLHSQSSSPGSYDYIIAKTPPGLHHRPAQSFSPVLPPRVHQSAQFSPVFTHRRRPTFPDDEPIDGDPSLQPNPAYESTENDPPMHTNPAYERVELSK